MFIAFDVGETLIQYEGLALDWSEHYRPALRQALSGTGVTADEDTVASAIEILMFYNTRKNPRVFEVEAGEVTAFCGNQPFRLACDLVGRMRRRNGRVSGAGENNC